MNITLSLSESDRDRLEACARKLRASKSAVIEAMLRIATGDPGDHPLSNYLISKGCTTPDIDMWSLTPEEESAKRPRGARISRKPEPLVGTNFEMQTKGGTPVKVKVVGRSPGQRQTGMLVDPSPPAERLAKRPRGARVGRSLLESLDADDLAAAKEAKARIDAAAKRRADDEAMARKHRARNGRPAAKDKPRANTPSPKILITGPGATQISDPKAHSVNITHNYDPKAGKKA